MDPRDPGPDFWMPVDPRPARQPRTSRGYDKPWPEREDLPQRRGRRWLVGGVLLVVAAGSGAFALTRGSAHGYVSYAIENGAMAPTLVVGDHVLVNPGLPPKRGDVVILRIPRGLLVKRLVAVGGDTVSCGPDTTRCAVMSVNGTPIAENLSAGEYVPPVTVPAGDVYVVGDNRLDSYDSRSFGPVSTSVLRGTAVAVQDAAGEHDIPGSSIT